MVLNLKVNWQRIHSSQFLLGFTVLLDWVKTKSPHLDDFQEIQYEFVVCNIKCNILTEKWPQYLWHRFEKWSERQPQSNKSKGRITKQKASVVLTKHRRGCWRGVRKEWTIIIIFYTVKFTVCICKFLFL